MVLIAHGLHVSLWFRVMVLIPSWWLVCSEVKWIAPIHLEKSGLSGGKQAQTMAVLSSIAFHKAVSKLVYVKSGFLVFPILPTTTALRSRIMLIIQVKKPKTKTNIRAYFWRRGSLSCAKAGIGKRRIVKSVIILRHAFVICSAVPFTQFAGIVRSQKCRIGTQMKKLTRSVSRI